MRRYEVLAVSEIGSGLFQFTVADDSQPHQLVYGLRPVIHAVRFGFIGDVPIPKEGEYIRFSEMLLDRESRGGGYVEYVGAMGSTGGRCLELLDNYDLSDEVFAIERAGVLIYLQILYG